MRTWTSERRAAGASQSRFATLRSGLSQYLAGQFESPWILDLSAYLSASCSSSSRSKTTRGVTIALVSSRERTRRQTGIATDDPAFVCLHQLVIGILGSYAHFDFVCRA